jgi:hypothetical protein
MFLICLHIKFSAFTLVQMESKESSLQLLVESLLLKSEQRWTEKPLGREVGFNEHLMSNSYV